MGRLLPRWRNEAINTYRSRFVLLSRPELVFPGDIIADMRKLILALLLTLTAGCLAGFLLYQIPSLHERLAWRVKNLQAQIYYALNPPQQAVFIPQQQEVEAIVQATLRAFASLTIASATPSPTLASTPYGATATPPPTPTPSLTPTAIPGKVILSGLKHEYQQMNNCGPATLAIALSFWGWQGDQRDTRAYLRPNFSKYDDKNVMPAEMVDYVEKFTGLKALVRVGGDVEILKRLVAAGFPVIIEKGFQPPKEDWMGHFEVINGYDDSRQRFITQDSYIMADFPLPYNQLSEHWWRDFNYVFMVIYPPEREAQVLSILGPQADLAISYQHAAEIASREAQNLSGRDLYFAWFNLGTNRLALGDYPGAAQAYDQAFALYARLPEEQRPWRMLWYQTGPYEAYYRTARYQDVIDLANTTLSSMQQPTLEESFYWRGMAREGLGDLDGAQSDYLKSVELNPNFTPGILQLQRLGVQAP